MAEWGYVGKHRVRIDGDVFVTINEGPVALKEMCAIMDQIKHAVDHDGVRFLLMNLARAEAPTPDTRRWMTKNPYQGISAVAGYGANRALRFMSDLMRKAMDLLNPHNQRTPFRLFDTETEARAYFDTLRNSSSRA